MTEGGGEEERGRDTCIHTYEYTASISRREGYSMLIFFVRALLVIEWPTCIALQKLHLQGEPIRNVLYTTISLSLCPLVLSGTLSVCGE